jgi:hypothetical protein
MKMSGEEPLSAEEARERGISTVHSRMANGEIRFRLRSKDGTAYIRTEASHSPDSDRDSWQSSHFHQTVRETYIVQTGRIALVELVDNGKVRTRLFEPDGIVTTMPFIPHNVFMFAGSVTHTVKHGIAGDVTDWHAFEPLDAVTRDKGLRPQQILERAGTLIPIEDY